jgi:hypothetical protein
MGAEGGTRVEKYKGSLALSGSLGHGPVIAGNYDASTKKSEFGSSRQRVERLVLY